MRLPFTKWMKSIEEKITSLLNQRNYTIYGGKIFEVNQGHLNPQAQYLPKAYRYALGKYCACVFMHSMFTTYIDHTYLHGTGHNTTRYTANVGSLHLMMLCLQCTPDC